MVAFSVVMGCSDPPAPSPTPGPRDLPRWSTAPHVQWASLGDTLVRPLAVFVGESGGSIDRLAADPDVATFLNDRFHPYFLIPTAAPGLPRGVTFLDLDGCVLSVPSHPTDPAALIALANSVVAPAGKQTPQTLPVPSEWKLDLGPWPSHPLHAMCTKLR